MAAYFVGLLGSAVLLLALPLLLVLGAIGVGLIILFALFMITLFGRMVVVRFVGLQFARQLGFTSLQNPMMTLLLGTVLLCLMYTIPVIGLGVWVGVIPLAVGSVLMAGLGS